VPVLAGHGFVKPGCPSWQRAIAHNNLRAVFCVSPDGIAPVILLKAVLTGATAPSSTGLLNPSRKYKRNSNHFHMKCRRSVWYNVHVAPAGPLSTLQVCFPETDHRPGERVIEASV
jgi:hypothetical protein